MPYDPEVYPHQRIDVVNVPPQNASLEIASFYGRATLGDEAFNGLQEELKKPPANLIKVMMGRVAVRQNVLVATAHASNVLDTALTHNAVFCASEDENFAHQNALVTNKLMSRLAIGEEPVTNILSSAGRLFIGIPYSASAQNAGLSQSLAEQVNRPMGIELLKALKQGMVLHRALSDTVAKEKALPDGKVSRIIPRVSESMAHIVKKRFPYVLPIAMWLNDTPSVDPRWKIVKPHGIIKADDVHLMMSDLATEISELSETPVGYELPAHLQRKKREVISLAADKPKKDES